MMGSVTCGKSRVLLAYSHACRNVKNNCLAQQCRMCGKPGVPRMLRSTPLFGVMRC
jgi:hypothetical protein